MEYGHLVLSNLEGVVNNDEFDKGEHKKDTEIFEAFPEFTDFLVCFKSGGSDIFKLFERDKAILNKSNFTVNWGLFGVVDKQALLNHLNRLTQEEKILWNAMIKGLEDEKERKVWNRIDLSNQRYLEDKEEIWTPIKWVGYDDPDWNSPRFKAFLHAWENPKRTGKRKVIEWWDNELQTNNRLVVSPIMSAVFATKEAEDYDSRS